MKTKKKFPLYNIDSPKYQSLPILYDNLAYQDAAFQANQIIIESFNDYIVNKGIDGNLLICQQASLHKISAGTDDLERIREMMAELYIVQTYNIAELFFKEFNKEYQAIHKIKAWKTTKKIGNSDKNLDPLNQLLNNIDKSKKRNLEELPEYLLADYYRLLRNGYVHREVKKSTSLKKPSEHFSKNIIKLQYYFDQYYKDLPDTGAPAPNNPDSITFQDFILYSRALRGLANYLNELCAFTVEQAFELAENDPKFLNTPRKINYRLFPDKKNRLDTFLIRYYKSHFGMSSSQIKSFVRLFYEKY